MLNIQGDAKIISTATYRYEFTPIHCVLQEEGLLTRAGIATFPSWYRYILGQSSRADLLTQSRDLPTEIDFTVRLAITQDKKSSKCLRSWSTVWKNKTDSVLAVVQWKHDISTILNEAVLHGT